MVSHETYGGVPAEPAGFPGLANGDGSQSRAGMRLLGKRAESKKSREAGMLHLFPRDRRQVTSDKTKRDSRSVQMPQSSSDTGTYLAAQIGAHPAVRALGLLNDRCHRTADFRVRSASFPEHRGHNVAVEHAMCANPLHAGGVSRYCPDSIHQRVAMMRSRTADQCAIDVEQNYCRRHSLHRTHSAILIKMTREFEGGKSVQLLQGDITKVPADAIANAANSELLGGGGVDGAIHLAGGPAIKLELDAIKEQQGGCPTGSAVATTAGQLPAKYVFHAVGPVYSGGSEGEPELLASAYRSCLALAEEKGISYLSFPSISTGIYGYPVADAAFIALRECVDHLRNVDHKLQKIIFVLFDDKTHKAYKAALREVTTATS